MVWKLRIITVATILLLVCTSVGCALYDVASAEGELGEEEEEPIEPFASTINDNGWNFMLEDDGTARIVSYSGKSTALEIPSTVTDGYEDFTVTVLRNTTNGPICSTKATSVIFPETLTTIGDYAFKGVSKLTSIHIPENVTYIGISAFEMNSNTPQSITIEDGDRECVIGDRAFYGVKAKEIHVGEGVTTIGVNAFDSNQNITSIYVPSTLTDYQENSFATNWVFKDEKGNTIDRMSAENFVGYTYLGTRTNLVRQVEVIEDPIELDDVYYLVEGDEFVLTVPENTVVSGADWLSVTDGELRGIAIAGSYDIVLITPNQQAASTIIVVLPLIFTNTPEDGGLESMNNEEENTEGGTV